MPTNRKRVSRIRRDSIFLDETVKQFLLTGETPERNTPGWSLYVSRFFNDSKGDIRAAWIQHRTDLLAEWKREKRPGLPWAENQFSIER